MKKGDVVEIIDSLGTYIGTFEKVVDNLSIICSPYIALGDEELNRYKTGRWCFSSIKSLRVIESKEEKRII